MGSALQPPSPCTVVIFGASGDLAQRLLVPALYNLAEMRLLPERFAVIGMARTEWSAAAFRARLEQAVAEAEDEPLDEGAVARALHTVDYVAADFDDDAGWQRLADSLARAAGAIGSHDCLFYLATAPELFRGVCERLAAHGLLQEVGGRWRRVVVEKPFGRDLRSARELNRALLAVMDETQIYRIDHYLGKETVQNILVFRFGNGIFEPIWNRRYVDHVQITVAETLGVEQRGGYYETAGALRDMVPNHLLQMLTLTAMEPPSSLEASGLHNEQVKVLDAIEPLQPEQCGGLSVRAQYTAGAIGGHGVPGYREEPRVSPGSSTETYAAFRLAVDNWRWAGVPFYLRTGKRLAKKKTEVVIQFRQPPLALFREASMAPPEPNHLVISIQPDETIKLRFAAKVPGPDVATTPVDMRFNYADHFGIERHTGYETLLFDAMTGDRSLFKRADMIEAGWAVVDPILVAWAAGACGLDTYAAGADGPASADALLAGDGRRWRRL